MTIGDPATLAAHFATALAGAGVPYAIGGAVAYVACVGEDDARVRRWDAISAAL